MGTIELKKDYGFLKGGTLYPLYIHQAFDRPNPLWRRPAVIVVPGGGYGMVCPREGEVIAARFLAKGFQTFVLTYLAAKEGVSYPEERNELGAAIDYLKKNADAFHINKKEIFAVGFSAGGHLVADVAMEEKELREKYSLDAKLKGIGLAYPVISYEEGEVGTYRNLLKGYEEEEKGILQKKLSLEKHVTKENPPAYVFATGNDQVVPVSNAIRYASALFKNGVMCELHVFPNGAHGFSSGDGETCSSASYFDPTGRVRYWTDECASFFRSLVEEPF